MILFDACSASSPNTVSHLAHSTRPYTLPPQRDTQTENLLLLSNYARILPCDRTFVLPLEVFTANPEVVAGAMLAAMGPILRNHEKVLQRASKAIDPSKLHSPHRELANVTAGWRAGAREESQKGAWERARGGAQGKGPGVRGAAQEEASSRGLRLDTGDERAELAGKSPRGAAPGPVGVDPKPEVPGPEIFDEERAEGDGPEAIGGGSAPDEPGGGNLEAGGQEEIAKALEKEKKLKAKVQKKGTRVMEMSELLHTHTTFALEKFFVDFHRLYPLMVPSEAYLRAHGLLSPPTGKPPEWWPEHYLDMTTKV